MSIVKVTCRPQFYDLLAALEELLPPGAAEPPTGKLQLRFSARQAGLPAQNQRRLAQTLGKALGEKPCYIRNHGESAYWNKGFYRVAGWKIQGTMEGAEAASPLFGAQEIDDVLPPVQALFQRGLVGDMLEVYFTPERLDRQLILNLCNILEARSALLTQALGLREEVRILAGRNVGLGVALSDFSVEKMEAVALLLYQAVRQAAAVGKARMKIADGSNARFQMRSWLLRLGFIGEQFERPRRTLLALLPGDAAFFTAESRKKACNKRLKARAERLR